MDYHTPSYIYIIISRTETGFARALRRFGCGQYNHAAIALDSGLRECYAFARPEQYGYLKGKLVHETVDRYLVNAKDGLPIKVYKIAVSPEQYNETRKTIEEIQNDPEYMYNLFSVLTYPITKGFSTWKAYTCIEFVCYMLNELGFKFDKPFPQVKPDDLIPMLEDYLIFDGNILDYAEDLSISVSYFKPISPALIAGSVLAAGIILSRSVPGIRKLGNRK